MVQARSGTLPLTERVNGVVEARNQVAIQAEVGGRVVNVLVRSGVDGERLSPAVVSAMQQARQRPFSGTLAGGTLTPDERILVGSVLAEASVDAFRLGVAVIGGLALLAAALAFTGLRERPAPAYDAAGTIGCPITGVRTHPDAAPIGSRAIASRRA